MTSFKDSIMKFNSSTIGSPLGDLLAATDQQEVLRALEFSNHKSHMLRTLRAHYGAVELVEQAPPHHLSAALERYFGGELAALNEITTTAPGSDLQQKVWSALRAIPAGQTTSYGELARALGYDDPRMAIEVGTANGANPIAIVVPCHRVIAKNGDLKGYAWGVHRKRWLLEHEGALPAQPTPASDGEARLPGF
jgi:methylated-DNA-[protein]-cysteine S-methyltransferase